MKLIFGILSYLMLFSFSTLMAQHPDDVVSVPKVNLPTTVDTYQTDIVLKWDTLNQESFVHFQVYLKDSTSNIIIYNYQDLGYIGRVKFRNLIDNHLYVYKIRAFNSLRVGDTKETNLQFINKKSIGNRTLSMPIFNLNRFCKNDNVNFNFTTTGNWFPNFYYILEMSDVNGSFDNPFGVIQVTSPGSYNFSLRNDTISKSGYYKFRIRTTYPNTLYISEESEPIFVTALGGAYISIYPEIYVPSGGPIVICNDKSVNIYTFTNIDDDNTKNYQWFLNDIPILDATNKHYSASFLSTTARYSVKVSKNECVVESLPEQLFSTNANSSYVIADRRANCYDTPKVLRSEYVSNSASYQWYKNNLLIPNATDYHYTVTEKGIYEVQVTDSGCEFGRGKFDVQISDSFDAMIYANDSILCGNGGQRIVIQTETLPNAKFQWRRNGMNITGEKQQYILADQPGVYSLSIVNGVCKTTTKSINIVSTNNIVLKLTAPWGTTLCNGRSIYLKIENFLDYSYCKWYRNGVLIPDITSQELWLSETGNYQVKIDIGYCVAESNIIAVVSSPNNINAKIKVIDDSPFICNNYPITLSFADGYNNQTIFNWYKNNNLIATNSPSLTTNEVGTYKLIVQFGQCVGESNNIELKIDTSRTIPVVVDNSLFPIVGKIEVCPKNSIRLELRSGITNMGLERNLQWFKDGEIIPNENRFVLWAEQPGKYQLKATDLNGGCKSQSKVFEIEHINPPKGILESDTTLINLGQQVHLNYEITGVGKTYYKIANYLDSVNNSVNLSKDIFPLETKNYKIEYVTNWCSSGETFGNHYAKVIKCQDKHIITESLNENNILNFQAKSDIDAVNKVFSGSKINYRAGSSISLLPGFNSYKGAIFKAEIGSCNN